jgi:hypothetical protein
MGSPFRDNALKYTFVFELLYKIGSSSNSSEYRLIWKLSFE